MRTEDFLRAVLPSQGHYFLAVPKEPRGYKHKAFTDIGKLASAAQYVSSKGANAFFALAGYDQPEYIGEDGKKHWRTGENARWARSQWMDLDGDKKKNLKDLFAFCEATGLPLPNIMVDSGNGLHVYWVFDRDVPRDSWRKSARVLKALAARLEFAQNDTSRTADISSVLRPVGTTNDKTHKGLGVKPVKTLGTPKLEPFSYAHWLRLLIDAKAKFAVEVPDEAPKENINGDLGGGMEHPPSSAHIVAEHCAQIKFFRDYQGAGQDEPTWRNCIGVVKHCIEGEELVHEWSSGHDGYDAGETAAKIRGWQTGPATCDSFKACNPSVCSGCAHAVKSPIQLGKVAPEQATEVSHVDPETSQVVVEELPELPESIARRFRFTGEYLEARTEDDDGVVTWVPFCNTYIRPIGYFLDKNDKNTWKMRVDCRMRPFKWQMFEITSRAIGQGGSVLMGELSAKAFVVPAFGRAKILEDYMRTWAEHLKHHAEETEMHSHMGWQADDSLVIGDRKYMPDGTIKRVVLDESLRNQIDDFEIKGDLPRYSELINFLYNRPNHQAYQFTWLTGFASTMINFISPDPLGLIFSAHGEGGLGKTTAAKLAAGVFHKTSKTVSSSTEYGLYVSAGQRKNLILVLDEASNWDNKFLSDFSYIYSTGTAKIQGAAGGGLRDTSHLNWNNATLLTTNNRLWEMVQSHRQQCLPQLMRIFEYTFDVKHAENAEADKGFQAVSELMLMHGVAGDAYAKYIVQNREAAKVAVNEAYHKLMKAAGLQKDARFWCYGAATIWHAFQVTKGLGIHAFDAKEFLNWLIAQLKRLNAHALEATNDMALVFGDMMSDLQAGFIVTMNEGHVNGQMATFAPGYQPPRGEVTGRVVVDKGLVYVNYSSVRDWCQRRGFSASEMRRELTNLGWLKSSQKYTLGRGTMLAIGQTRVLQLDWKAFSGQLKVVAPQGEPLEEEVA